MDWSLNPIIVSFSSWLTAKSLEPDCLDGDKHEKSEGERLEDNLVLILALLYLISMTLLVPTPRWVLHS